MTREEAQQEALQKAVQAAWGAHWFGLDERIRKIAYDDMARALSAAEAAMAGAGWVRVRDVGEAAGGLWVSADATTAAAWAKGWNACRAAMLSTSTD